jgi:hypothetical protein
MIRLPLRECLHGGTKSFRNTAFGFLLVVTYDEEIELGGDKKVPSAA